MFETLDKYAPPPVNKQSKAYRFAIQFTDVDDKPARESGFYFNSLKMRIEYHHGPKFVDSISVQTLGDEVEPDDAFEKWCDRVLGRRGNG